MDSLTNELRRAAQNARDPRSANQLHRLANALDSAVHGIPAPLAALVDEEQHREATLAAALAQASAPAAA